VREAHAVLGHAKGVGRNDPDLYPERSEGVREGACRVGDDGKGSWRRCWRVYPQASLVLYMCYIGVTAVENRFSLLNLLVNSERGVDEVTKKCRRSDERL